MISTHPPAPRRPSAKPLIAAGLLLALAGLVFDLDGLKTLISLPQANAPRTSSTSCQAVVKADAQISREQLAQLLAIPERDTKSRVRQVVNEPYCQYSSISIRSGVPAEREAYPLEFDPGTTLVILYENEEYAGYRFSFN